LPERYLIGPRLYPLFQKTVFIVLPITVILGLIGLGVSLGRANITARDIVEIVSLTFGNLFGAAFTTLGSIAAIFAIVEWALYRAGGKVDIKGTRKEKEWDPHSLAKISPPDRVDVGGNIAEIVMAFAAIVIFNFYPHIIGFTPSLNSVVESGDWRSLTLIPILSEAFFRYVPVLTAVWGLTIVLDIVVLRQGNWNAMTRWFLVGLKAIKIAIAAAMLAGPSIIALTPEALSASIGDTEAAGVSFTLLTLSVRVALWLTIILEGVDIVKTIYRLIAKRELPLVVPGKSQGG
jgi:hypothetical protein